MENLNLPTYSFKLKFDLQRKLIFDSIRKKYVVLTPEEWVRQNFIRYLVEEKGYPDSLIAVEKKVDVNLLPQRSDIVFYNKNANPVIIVECKSTKIKITQEVFNQIARYNMKLRVPFLVVTNGLRHFCCYMDYEKQSFQFMEDIPNYQEIKNL
ncbi:type I restriction enzyme HsdR N-terminal domain-containing protein [Marinifilum sp. RC60d5]|uniref:type I restriction enzyme HsdR N-terminal domain-containing protein n=1 Tax=Marinifilum sp. RC60d5 TaxID=3458414 RepID=UPI004035D3A9